MHTNGANGGHQHEVSEKRPTPDIFTNRIDMEICICGARRWVDQDGTPATPWQSINLETSPMGKEDAGMALRAPPKSALDGLITCGSCGQPMLLDDTGGSRKPTTSVSRDTATSGHSARRHGCTPLERRSCWSARRCKQS